jgi:hypothetical protein
MLRSKLRFIKDFYEKGAKPFETTRRQIEKHEGPYRHYPPGYDPEDGGEPPHLDDWMEAGAALNILGQSCLCLAQISFRDFLDGFMERGGCGKPSAKGNWFKRYARFFREEYGIDWSKAPVDLELLEDISLTRNSIQHTEHPIRFYELDRQQTTEHHSRFPDSIFADEIEKRLMPASSSHGPYRISVTRTSLYAAIDVIDGFCTYLDQQGDC